MNTIVLKLNCGHLLGPENGGLLWSHGQLLIVAFSSRTVGMNYMISILSGTGNSGERDLLMYEKIIKVLRKPSL